MADHAGDEQRLWLKEASNAVKKNAFFLRKAMDEGDLAGALRYATALLGELRISLLGPQKYYELYMQAADQLSRLEAFFEEEAGRGTTQYADLYERVQHAGNVLPRLYLLFTVAGAYIRGRGAPAKAVLRDAAEMAKGVQHPTRGLFLRAYLLQVVRGLLPDAGSPYEGPEGGGVVDSVEFLLSNFTEMNKLWVRMQHQGEARDQGRREAERGQLSDLVGKNLTALAALEGVELPLYRDVVLPRVLEQVVGCKDPLAQQYLMQCVAAAFPDDFHLRTLSSLLGALPSLAPGVRVHSVLATLLDRLARYAASDPAVVEEMNAADAFGSLANVALAVVRQQPDVPAADVAATYGALLGFAGAVYPGRLELVDSVLATCHEALAARGPVTDPRAERQVVDLLSAPVEQYDVVMVLGLPHFAPLLGLLAPGTRRTLAARVVGAALAADARIAAPEQAELVLGFAAPLIKDVEGLELSREEVGEDTALVARLLHGLRADTPDAQHAVLAVAHRHLSSASAERLRVTLPALGFRQLEAIRDAAAAAGDAPPPKVSLEVWFRGLHGTATSLAEAAGAPGPALGLFLAGAHAASEQAGLEVAAYEFLEQAFLLYEESMPDSKQEVRALHSIMGTLQRCRVFGEDNRGALAHKCSGYCAKLLRRPDQARAVLASSHLHWQEEAEPEAQAERFAAAAAARQPAVRDASAVVAALRRALKLAAAARAQLAVGGRASTDVGPAYVYVDILNSYLYYFDRGVGSIAPADLQSLLELVAGELSGEACAADEELQRYYASTLHHVEAQRAAGGAVAQRYAAVAPPKA